MELADTDGNGTISYTEFHNLFSKIKEFALSDDEIKSLFETTDANNN